MSGALDPAKVRSALRDELEARGYSVAKDSAGPRSELYIWGEGDRAAALFEFKSSADEACATMYRGSWLSTLPPRFAVLPLAERNASATDFLQQAGLSVLFYTSTDDRVAFVDFEAAVDEIARRGVKLD